MKGVGPKLTGGGKRAARKSKPDAETSLIFIIPGFSMTWRFGSGFFVIPNQVLNLIQDLRFRDLGFGFEESRF
jgi:hypothetical protein